MSLTCSTTPGGGCKCPKTEGSPNAQLMTVFPGLGVALKLSMISRIGFRVCDADVEAVIDQVFSSSQRRRASSFEEDVRGISRASPFSRSLSSGRNCDELRLGCELKKDSIELPRWMLLLLLF